MGGSLSKPKGNALNLFFAKNCGICTSRKVGGGYGTPSGLLWDWGVSHKNVLIYKHLCRTGACGTYYSVWCPVHAPEIRYDQRVGTWFCLCSTFKISFNLLVP